MRIIIAPSLSATSKVKKSLTAAKKLEIKSKLSKAKRDLKGLKKGVKGGPAKRAKLKQRILRLQKRLGIKTAKPVTKNSAPRTITGLKAKSTKTVKPKVKTESSAPLLSPKNLQTALKGLSAASFSYEDIMRKRLTPAVRAHKLTYSITHDLAGDVYGNSNKFYSDAEIKAKKIAYLNALSPLISPKSLSKIETLSDEATILSKSISVNMNKHKEYDLHPQMSPMKLDKNHASQGPFSSMRYDFDSPIPDSVKEAHTEIKTNYKKLNEIQKKIRESLMPELETQFSRK